MYAMNGRVGLITGGGGGIGREIARRLAGEGMAVAMLDRDEAAARAVAAETGGLAVVADVTSPEASSARSTPSSPASVNSTSSSTTPVSPGPAQRWKCRSTRFKRCCGSMLRGSLSPAGPCCRI